ncbi:2,5-diketo-D-gluconic acid reductase [Serinicoccus chungangensis]|uniref:2,5-diketo-D-gluconic acid reductase n=1 Tax=Serinicoccus chungangensis TaxID=767452 RepID=A0A0W8I311_9MICO|nr:aldo/keto reductase [Serinicoccus chungangensis]KUG51994.1 2,5-diketo-D-gluconic acid reductase [Serinicoccus chungangensis]
MILQETSTLANGVTIPRLGLGTWFISDTDVVPAVGEALRLGYRHVDTAPAYRNEQGVGRAVRGSGVPRDEVFVTTKVDAGAKTHDAARDGIDSSLRRTGLDHLDLVLVHSPTPWRRFGGEERYLEENRQVWRALEEALAAGKVRAIGLSNFEVADVDNILEGCTVAPMVNQVLAHISNTPHQLIRWCEDRGILVQAYSPVAHGELLRNEEVARVAQRYAVSVPQLSIRYCLQLGLVPLPKSADPAHLRANTEVDFTITEEDMDLLRAVEQIADYGEHRAMTIYGGQRDLRSLLALARGALRSRRTSGR